MPTLMEKYVDGKWLAVTDEEVLQSKVLPDGHRIRIPMTMLDSKASLDADRAFHRAKAEASRQVWIDRMTNAWRGSRDVAKPQASAQEKASPAKVGDAYGAYLTRITNAWKQR